ncbi:MAG: hypothetical protein H0W72_15190 [Planctomycetes bacterium]|nr:hypothetical protein [Planctomycetota bacterium]
MQAKRIVLIIGAVIVIGLAVLSVLSSSTPDAESATDVWADDRIVVDALAANLEGRLRAKDYIGMHALLDPGSQVPDQTTFRRAMEDEIAKIGELVLIGPGGTRFEDRDGRPVGRLSRSLQGTTGNAVMHVDVVKVGEWKVSGVTFAEGMQPILPTRPPENAQRPVK